jgi:transcriptional regulator with XRE-family HTH domain
MVEKDLQRFGARVRAERERLGISQEELADQAGLHRTYLGSIERGERNVGLINVIRIAGALGVVPSVLFKDFDGGRRR